MTKQDDRNSELLQTPQVDGNGSAGNGEQPDLDAATLSVSRALRTSFLALKIVLFGLIALYLGSGGYFTLPPGSKAVVVRFGQIQGRDSQAGPILAPGPHWMWPWPVSEKIEQDTEKSRTQNVAFWFFIPEQYRGRKMEDLTRFAPPVLTPGEDGYLLSGEQEIVHLQCAVKYKVDDLVAYATHVTDEHALIQTIGEWACARVVAGMRTDAVVRGEDDTFKEGVKRLMQGRLDEVSSGLSVIDIVINQREVPLQVRDAYLQVVQTETEKLKVVSAARTTATQVLNRVAGGSHEPLKQAIQAYELARATSEAAQADTQMKQILALIDKAGGEIANTIGDAMAERSRLDLSVRAEVRRFQDLYSKYEANPSIFIMQLWADARAEILSSPELEVIYLPYGGKELRMTLDHNPQFLKAREARKYAQQVNQGG